MVEEMYKEEFTDGLEENDPNLSSEGTPRITEIQEQQIASSSNHEIQKQQNGSSYNHEHASGVAGSSSMVQNTVACGGGGFMMTRLGSGGVSLTLGIQNSETHGAVPMSGGIDNYENAIPGTDFQYLNSGNRQHRLGPSQLLHDFVA